MGFPGIIVCNAATAICGIVFGRAVTATARNRVMGTEMAVALEEGGEGEGEGGKSDGDGDKEGNGE